MKVAICDDMMSTAHQTEELLLDYNKKLFDIDVFYDPVRLLESCKNEYYDFFILDIEMEKINGVKLARKIRDSGNQNPIVFLTSYKQYMEEVFKFHTFDYLLKPLEKREMYSLIDRLLNYLNFEENRFVFKFNRVSHSLLFSDIVYFEKNKRVVIVHTKKKKFEVFMTTEDLLGHLDGNFVRVHNSFIVNIRYIKELKSNALELVNGQQVPMSRKFSKAAKEKIIMKMRELM